MIWIMLVWLLGQGGLWFYMKHKNENLEFSDVLWTFVFSMFIGFVFSYAAAKANLSFWAVYVVIAVLSAFTTYKLLEKKDQPLFPGTGNSGEPMAAMAGGVGTSGKTAARLASEKYNLRMVLVAGVIWLFVLLCFVAFNTYQHELFKKAEIIPNIIGIILWAASYFMLYNGHRQLLPAKNGFVYYIGVIALLGLALATMTGFNQDLFGIKNIP